MRHLRRLLLAMALAVTTTLIIPAGSAQAGYPAGTACFPIGTPGTIITIGECHDIVFPEIEPGPPWPPEWCPECFPSFGFRDDVYDPKIQFEYRDLLGQGYGYLAEATLTKDPKVAEELRAKAADLFLDSAEVLGKSKVELGSLGWADLKENKYHEDPTPTPMMEAVGQDLVLGLQLMQQALGDPSPQPSIEAAMKRFDESYANLAKLYAG